MDGRATGAPPPIFTPPTSICRLDATYEKGIYVAAGDGPQPGRTTPRNTRERRASTSRPRSSPLAGSPRDRRGSRRSCPRSGRQATRPSAASTGGPGRGAISRPATTLAVERLDLLRVLLVDRL